MTEMLQDLKYGFRMLLKNPGFTFAAVTTLALGIGLNAATFSTVYGLLYRPLGGAESPDELVQMYREWPDIPFGSNSLPHYIDLRDRTGDAFESVTAWQFAQIGLTVDGESERLMGMLVGANFFQTYGATPAVGRFFIPGVESEGIGAHPVAVLGYGYWQSRFGGDPSVVGRTVIANGHPFEVVGVSSAEFRGPVSFAEPPIYVPFTMQLEIAPGSNWWETRGSNMLTVVGRLRDGVEIAMAQQVVDATVAQLAEQYPEDYEDQLGTRLVAQADAGIHPSLRGAQMGMSGVIMGVVVLLLLIACVNVANLFLARARDRRREMGVRLSIGASRERIIRQLLTESLLFALISGGAGVLLAMFATRALSVFKPPVDGPWAFDVGLDPSVLLFTLLITVSTGILFGLAPALQAARPDTLAAIKGESDGGGRRSRTSNVLVVGQMALSLVLLISSGLFLRGLQGAMQIDPGFDDPARLMLLSTDPALQGYDEVRSREFQDRLLERVRAIPEVSAAGLTDAMPLGFNSQDRGVSVPGYEFGENERSSFRFATITEGHLEAMGVALLEGRAFRETDDANGPGVIIVNRKLADRFWPGEPALGRTIRAAGRDREVIGVVETGKYSSLNEAPTDFMYLPQRDDFRSSMSLTARTTNPQVTLGAIRGIVRELDPNMPMFDVRSMEDHMGVALLPARIGGWVLGIFGILGLLLAAVGIYGVMAYSVAQRTRELGVRVALGADRASVVKLVLGEGMKLAMIGMALGLLGALGAGQLVKGFIYNVSPFDPVALVGVPLTLAVVAGLAVWIPARRAAGVDPIRALKAE